MKPSTGIALAASFKLGLALSSNLTSRCTPSTFESYVPDNTTLIYATPYPANTTFVTGAITGNVLVDVPFCALYLNTSSSSTSSFETALWLPLEGWTGRYTAYGNGGFVGAVAWADFPNGLKYGFASVSTNTGHNSTSFADDGSFALNNPEKQSDWGWRALHESVVMGKSLTTAFYQQNITYSYYAGCSTGGRQGLKSLEAFPDDFDGVVAGAPAWWTTHLQNWNLKVETYNMPANASWSIPQNLGSLVNDEVYNQCDGIDGLTDGIIMNPYVCNFRPETLICTSPNATNCLTGPQIDTVYHMFNDWIETNQTFVFPGFPLGTEVSFSTSISDSDASIGYAKYFVYNDTNWPWENLDFETILLSEEINPGQATADDFDLRPFVNKGGKLLHYHGLADPSITAGSSIYFYNQVLKTLAPYGVNLDSFYRLFLVPGMLHCLSSSNNAPWYFAGATQILPGDGGVQNSVPGYADAKHDVILAIIDWVENGVAPDEIIATKYVDDDPAQGVLKQRQLCPYPSEAIYVGGNPNVTSSWECS